MFFKKKSHRPVVFMHIHKTAGTTIVDLAQKHYGYHNVMAHGDFRSEYSEDTEYEKFFNKNAILERHNDKLFVSGHFGYDYCALFMKERYSFTFIRDPKQRIVSLYNFFKTRPNEREIPFQTWVQSISLEQFLESALQDNECKFDSKMFLKNKQLWQLAGGFLPEDVNRLKEKYSEADAQQLAFEHLKTFSYVGIVEHFVHGRNIVLKAMDIAIPAEDIKCNETKSPKVSDLSHTVQEMLYELTAMEQPIYDYVLQKTVEEQKLSNKARKFLQFTRPHKRDW